MAKNDRPTKAELEEDRFVEWIMGVFDFLKDRLQLVIGVVVALLLIVSGALYTRNLQEEERLKASHSLGKVLMIEANGNIVAAMEAAEILVAEHRGTSAAGQGAVFLANRYFNQGRFNEAKNLYEQFLDQYGDTDEVLFFAAWSGIAGCLESQEEFVSAAKKYEQYADQYGGEQASLALIDAARCYGLAGDTTAQKNALTRITKNFPTSPVVGKVREQLQAL